MVRSAPQHQDLVGVFIDQPQLYVFVQVDEYVIQGQATAQEWDIMFPEQEYIFGEFTERLWAYLTIEQLLDRKSVLFVILGRPVCYAIFEVV